MWLLIIFIKIVSPQITNGLCSKSLFCWLFEKHFSQTLIGFQGQAVKCCLTHDLYPQSLIHNSKIQKVLKNLSFFIFKFGSKMHLCHGLSRRDVRLFKIFTYPI